MIDCNIKDVKMLLNFDTIKIAKVSDNTFFKFSI